MTPTETTVTRVDPLDTAENQIAVLLEHELPEKPDEILLLRGRIAEIKNRASELLKQFDAEVMTPFVKERGAIEVAPGVRWVLKIDKTVKCKDLRAAIEDIYVATGGDYDAFVQCLSVNALKPGECRKVLGGAFDRHFETVVKEGVEEKASKKLALVNDAFVK